MLAAQQVVEAIVMRLVGATDAADRVYADRLWPLTEEKLPAWRVFDRGEDVTEETVHWPHERLHDMTAGLQACAQSVAGIDAVLSALRAQAETSLFAAPAQTVLGLNVQMSLAGMGPMEPIETADRQIAQRTLILNVRYRTRANQPETIL